MKRKSNRGRGHLYIDTRCKDNPTWYLRITIEGVKRCIRIGTQAEYPTESKAWPKADALRLAYVPPVTPNNDTVAELVEKFQRERMPKHFSSQKSYKSLFKCYIVPQWGNVKVAEVFQTPPVVIDNWIKALPLADHTKSNLRSLFSYLLDSAMYFGMVPMQLNPVTKLQMSSARTEQPVIVEQADFWALRAALKAPYDDMALVAYCLGLRFSELAGLQWGDINWTKDKEEITINRGVVSGRVGEVKTPSSRDVLPLHPDLVELFKRHRADVKLLTDGTVSPWIFASPFKAYEKSYSSNGGNKAIREAGEKVGIKGVGWHDLRHTYRTLMGKNGESLEVQKRLMRHSGIGITMKYGSLPMEVLRAANSKIVEMARPA